MAIGLIGRKAGMTRVFLEDGVAVPVTVIEVEPNRVTQVKSEATDGYRALQVTTGERRVSRVTKAAAGHYAKAGTEAGRGLWEFRLAEGEGADVAVGVQLTVDMFTAGQKVDVTGTTIGKGFAGTMKRHNFAGGPASHGHSVTHRAPGSIGQRQTPGRVFQGKRMSGHMGVVRRTVENLKVVEVDAEGFKPVSAAHGCIDDRRPLDGEAGRPLEVGQPGLFAFGAIQPRFGVTGSALVVEHDVAMGIAPVLGELGDRTAGPTGGNDERVGPPVARRCRDHDDGERHRLIGRGVAPVRRHLHPVAAG